MLHYPVNLDHGPGPLLVFAPEPDPDALAGAAVALTNTDGGAIVVGLDAHGSYTRLVADDVMRRALEQAGACCNPAVTFAAPQPLMTPQGPVRVIYVPRGDRVHALADGRVLVRTGYGNRVLSGEEIRRLLTGKSSGDFEAEIVPGARIADLDPTLLAEFMLQRQHRTGQHWSPNEEMSLIELGAVTHDYRVTVAGMLLFGRDPQRWLPHSGVRFARLLTDDGSQVAFERRLSGGLPRLLDALWEAIRQQVREPAPSPDGPPEEEYPASAVREALVNAVCHRDYRLRHDSVLVRLFPGRLEISSPGGLPGFLTTTEHLMAGRYSRNPRLSWGLYQWGYVAAPGAGILHILTSMDRYGQRPPEFVTEPYRFTVRLYSAAASHRDGSNGRLHLSSQQQAIVEYVRQHGSITLHECCVMHPTRRADRLQQDLTSLVEAALLLRIGARTGAYYILP